MVSNYLNTFKDPNTNLIAFDIETTGLTSALESRKLAKGEMYASPTEFAIKSSSGGDIYGFTNYASKDVYNKLSKGASFGAEYAEAGRRFAAFDKPTRSATELVDLLKHSVIPGKSNVIMGHNIGPFDLKILSAQYAQEQRFVTPEQIVRAQKVPFSNRSAEWAEIHDGWKRANSAINKTLRTHDSNLKIIDTLGKFRKGEFLSPYNTGKGLAQGILSGYLPGVRSHWYRQFIGSRLEHEEALLQSSFATTKGTSLAQFMGFIGHKFKGAAHDPRPDVANLLSFTKSDALHGYVSRLEGYHKTGNFAKLEEETQSYLNYQKGLQAKALRGGSLREGQKSLANFMVGNSKAVETEAAVNFTDQLVEGFMKAPKGVRILTGMAGLTLAYGVYKSVFGTKDEVRRIDGLHPGNKGMATHVIRSMTDFGSGWRGLIKIPRQLSMEAMGMWDRTTTSAVVLPDKQEIMSLVKRVTVRRSKKDLPHARQLVHDINQAFKAGLDPKQMIFVNEEGVRTQGAKTKQHLRMVIRHERQHTYSFATGQKAAMAFKMPPKLRDFIAGRYEKDNWQEESLAWVAGWSALGKGALGRLESQIGQEPTAEAMRSIKLTKTAAINKWKSQGRTSYGANLKNMPTHGLVNQVLSEGAQGHKRFQGKSF